VTDEIILQKFLEKPEDFPEYLHRTKDFKVGIDIYLYVTKVSVAASTIQSTVLYAMLKEWNPEEHDGEQFQDYFVRVAGQDIATIQNKLEVGEMLEKVPEKYLPDIQAKETKIKNAIADTVLDGYVIEDDQWDRIARADNYQQAAEVVREVKGVAPRSQWMKFTIDEHDIVWVHTAEGKFEFFRINGDSEIEDVIERAKKRLLRQANILPEVRY
jgi:hypothetical protein